MTLHRKNVYLFSLLALTVAASAWVTYMPENGASEAIVSAVSPANAKPHIAAEKKLQDNGQRGVALDTLQRSSMSVGDANPFNVKSWYVAPPAPAQAPTAPPKPTAPPLPFTYMGKMEEEAGWVVYLTKGEKFYTVTKGETFDEVYRLEGVENGNLVIQYLPLSVKQFLLIGEQS